MVDFRPFWRSLETYVGDASAIAHDADVSEPEMGLQADVSRKAFQPCHRIHAGTGVAVCDFCLMPMPTKRVVGNRLTQP